MVDDSRSHPDEAQSVLARQARHYNTRVRTLGQQSHLALERLLQAAFKQGVSDALLIAAERLQVDPRLAELCLPPQCPHYGKSLHCPPFTPSPDDFRASLAQYEQALVFKFDLPAAVLLSEERHPYARRVHQIAAALEQQALAEGFAHALGLAAGSCKPLFCHDEVNCSALQPGSVCRFPDQARPSLSAVGLDFFDLCRQLGWQIERITRASDPASAPAGMLAGLTLLG